MMEKWKSEYEIDLSTASSFDSELPSENFKYNDLKPQNLEEKLIEIHRIHSNIETLLNKYKEAFEWDEDQRRQHREDLRSRSQL